MTTPAADRFARAGGPVVTPQTLYALMKCERRLWLDVHDPSGRRADTDFDLELRDRGRAHKQDVRARVAGSVKVPREHRESPAAAAEEVLRLLRETRAPIEQPLLLSADGTELAAPDLLYWEGGGLVVCDARLAESVKPESQLQLSHAAGLLEERAGITPLRLEIVNGRGETMTVTRLGSEEVASVVARARALTDPAAPEPALLLAHSDCEECPYYERCWSRAEAERRIEVLPALQRNLLSVLAAHGIRTMEDLAARDPETVAAIRGVGRHGAALVHHARAFVSGEPQWVESIELPAGRPCVWLDVETDPQDETHGFHVYLWGLAVETGSAALEPEWIQSDADPGRDEETWRRFLARAAEILGRWPASTWVHYSTAERTAVRRYVARWGDPDGIAAALEDRLFDLHACLKKTVRLPIRSYGMKHVARHLGFAWRDAAAGSQWSLVEYRKARAATDPAERARRLAGIAQYNGDDQAALRTVWSWLEAAPRPPGT